MEKKMEEEETSLMVTANHWQIRTWPGTFAELISSLSYTGHGDFQ